MLQPSKKKMISNNVDPLTNTPAVHVINIYLDSRIFTVVNKIF